MHLISIARGPVRNLQRQIEEMQSNYFPIKHKGEDYWIPWVVREIKLLEYAFPREELQIVLNSIPNLSDHGVPSFIKKLLMSKLSLTKIPERVPGIKRIIFGDGVQNVLIGIKDDMEFEEGGEMI